MEIVRKTERVFTDSVRELSQKIVDSSHDILTINYEALEKNLVKKLQDYEKARRGGPDPFAEESLSPENELGLNLFLDVVNFCFKDPSTKRSYIFINSEGKAIQRANGLKAAMVNADINWGDTKEVSNLTSEKWAEIIQLHINKEFYLGAERGKRIALFAKKLNISGFANVSEFLDYTDYNTEVLLPVLAATEFFQDEFQKRSQLAANMMNGVLQRRFNWEFRGMDSLTVMADYRLPQLMYNFGTIELSDALKAKLITEEIIETGSREELALRGATVVIGKRLSDLMGTPEGKIDSLLWTFAVDLGLKGKLAIPHMLVPTDKY